MTVAELKTQPSGLRVGDFIKEIESDQVRKDCRQIMRIMREVTAKRPVMWGSSLVGYDRYQYQYASGHSGEWPITGFSPRKRNLSIYIMPGFEDYQDLLRDLGKHKHAKSCLYINQLADVDETVLKKLIDRSVADMRRRYQGD